MHSLPQHLPTTSANKPTRSSIPFAWRRARQRRHLSFRLMKASVEYVKRPRMTAFPVVYRLSFPSTTETDNLIPAPPQDTAFPVTLASSRRRERAGMRPSSQSAILGPLLRRSIVRVPPIRTGENHASYLSGKFPVATSSCCQLPDLSATTGTAGPEGDRLSAQRRPAHTSGNPWSR